MRVGPSLPAVLAVTCAVAAWLVCDFQRLGAYPDDELVRTVAVTGGASVGAVMGGLLHAEAVVRSRLKTAIALLVILPLLGALTAVVSSLALTNLAYFAIASGEAPLIGALGGLAALPGVALTARAARRADRARPGSVVHEIERRGVWTLPTAAIAIGAMFTAFGNPALLRQGQPAPVAAAAIAIVASVSLAITLAQAIGAAQFAAAVWATGSELRPHDADAVENRHIPRLDLGIGEQLLEHFRASGSAYRAAGGVQLIVRGDPMAANAVARRAAISTGIALAVAFAATIVAVGTITA